LSNTNAIHFEMIEANYPILRHFDDKILSYKVGAMKPSPRIYEEAIRRANCEPSEIFFTDDIPQYVEGAKMAGIDAVVFENAAQIQRELSARGVTW
ncbi:MAG TPA: HAD-IA family hydrolase, partial [Bryobacteraceae bacterium]|nr:HAD-IA family hydrolase [Bryobacteraceae bacterium]